MGRVNVQVNEPREVTYTLTIELEPYQAAEFAKNLGKLSWGDTTAIMIRQELERVGVRWEDFDAKIRSAAYYME